VWGREGQRFLKGGVEGGEDPDRSNKLAPWMQEGEVEKGRSHSVDLSRKAVNMRGSKLISHNNTRKIGQDFEKRRQWGELNTWVSLGT